MLAPGWVARLEEELGVRLPRVELPLASRRPGRIVERLSRLARAGGLYWVLLCRGLRCVACGFPEAPRVRVERSVERDVLSGLRHAVPRVVVECCGRVVAESRWDGSRVVLESFVCPVGVTGEGVYCWGRRVSGLAEAVECATRGP